MSTTDKTKLFRADEDDTVALVKRIKYILTFYSEWMSNKDDDKQDMYSVMNNGFDTDTEYNLKSFLSDYHFVVNDRNRKLITTEIHKMDDEMKDICDAEICRVIDRSEIDRSRSNRAYFCNQTDIQSDANKNIAVQQMLDSLHMFMYHTFRVHPTQYDHIQEVAQNEDAAEDESDDAKDGDDYDDKVTKKIVHLIQEAKVASRRFRRSRNTSRIHNKFMTVKYDYNDVADGNRETQDGMNDIAVYQSAVYGNEQLLLKKQQKVRDNSCVTDTLFQKLSADSGDDDTLNQLRTFLSNEAYDTEAITADLDFTQEAQSNLKRILLNRFEIAAMFVQRVQFEEYTKSNVYDPGVRFFYWPHFEDNEDERSLIYRAGGSYAYDWNRGYKLKDWYIPKKYDTLKEELTQNKTKPFPMDAYDTIIETASLKLNAYQSAKGTRRLICGWSEWRKSYGIARGDGIQLKHIVALLCYTDFSEYCYEFSKSFRKISPTETDESLKQRHREFHHCARNLRECVECFGVEMKDSAIPFYFHGISRSMLVDSTHIEFRGPVSTTSVFEVAVSRFAENGIVLQIRKNPGCRMAHWPCSYWSAYSDEYEYLYIGGLKYFVISSIRDIPNNQRYDSLIRTMTIIHYLVDGYDLADIIVKNRDVRIIRSLIQAEQTCVLLKGLDSKVPLYFLNLFHHFLNHLEYIDVNLEFMNKGFFMESGGHKYCGFKLLVPIVCFNKNPYALNYALLCGLIPNAKCFTVWRFQSGCKKSVELNKEFVSSVIGAIELDTKCEAFCIVEPSVPGSLSMSAFIDTHQALFHKYGWTLQQDETFQHPRRRSYSPAHALLIKKLKT
eukprot:954417_1